MPTLNPRINVTLSPSLDAMVARFAAVQQVSKAQVLRELLEAAEPALQRAVLLMEAAVKAPGQVMSGLASSLDRAQAVVEAELSSSLAQIDAASRDLVDQAEEVRGRRPARGATPPLLEGAPKGRRKGQRGSPAVSTPVPVTRGSGSGKTRKRGMLP